MEITRADVSPRKDRLDSMAGTLLTIGIFLLATFMLITMGAGIVTAPLIIPLLYIRVRMRPTRTFRIVGGLLAALTATELGWGITFLIASPAEPKPWIWLIPVLAAVAVGAPFVHIKPKSKV